ncbi:MAG: hypothetical protein AB7H93_25720 [Vicinamibacterales bacterium]
MKTGMLTRNALAPLFAVMLLGGAALADEPGSPASEDALIGAADETGLVAMDADALSDASGGFAVQLSNVDQDTNFSDNPVTVDNGSQINTGYINSSNANTGGITTTMLNTGNNVSFQNSTTLNIYLDAAQ